MSNPTKGFCQGKGRKNSRKIVFEELDLKKKSFLTLNGGKKEKKRFPKVELNLLHYGVNSSKDCHERMVGRFQKHADGTEGVYYRPDHFKSLQQPKIETGSLSICISRGKKSKGDVYIVRTQVFGLFDLSPPVQ